MKIFSAQQVRNWDTFTMEHEPVTSIDLMERASSRCVEWIAATYPETGSFAIFCGKGNNGGDGLAIARLLTGLQFRTSVYILEFGFKGTTEFQENLARLHQLGYTDIHFIQSELHFPVLADDVILIDALFGTGLNRPLDGVTASLVMHLNNSGKKIISIDMPSGLFADRSSQGNAIIKATHTLSFQVFKLAFLLPANADYNGEVHLLDIGLHAGFIPGAESAFELIDVSIARSLLKPRKKFAHKGDFGHALLVAGSYGKMGAAVLAAQACLRSGAGLLTCHVPSSGYAIIQTAVPEAMADIDGNERINTAFNIEQARYSCIGVGPGTGTDEKTVAMLRALLSAYRSPAVLDADALNILSVNDDILQHVSPGSILTPHPKEFERLFGATENDFERLQLAMRKAKELDCIIILKGHYSFIATATKGYFNTTGNAGMATGGSGDVLTGLLTGLMAQGYNSLETAILGVYLHGLAGDLAANNGSQESLVAGDIVAFLGKAFRDLQS